MTGDHHTDLEPRDVHVDVDEHHMDTIPGDISRGTVQMELHKEAKAKSAIG